MLSVRRATQNDLLDIFKLCVAMHQETQFSAFGLDPEKMIRHLGAWAENGMLLLVEDVKDDARNLTGMMVASLTAPWYSNEKMAVEEMLFVKKEFRGGRSAYLLVKEFMKWANEVGANHIRAGASTGTGDEAEKLYRHFGFDYVGGNYFSHSPRS